MLTHAYWQRKFGSDPDVVGRPLVVDGTPREIIGVLPAGFRFLDTQPQLVLPFRFDRAKLFVGNFSYQGDRAAQARRDDRPGQRRRRAA